MPRVRKAAKRRAVSEQDDIDPNQAPIAPNPYKGERKRGVPCDVVQLESDVPYDAIIKTAEKRGCDLIAMASHGRRGVAAIVLGSETLKVLTHSKVPVLVYR